MLELKHSALIGGVDEAGRGPLAGAVYAAAVILPPSYHLPGLKDSKKLSPSQRERLSRAISEQAVSFAIAKATVAEIENLNILQASLLAMSRAITQLEPQPTYILIDGNQLPAQLPCPARAIIKGDATIACISAASILAKVARDAEMLLLDQIYPCYDFKHNKGYGTKTHLEALRRYGYSPIHRKNFAPIKYMLSS